MVRSRQSALLTRRTNNGCGRCAQVDLFKTQMQVQLTRDGGRFRSVFHCAGHIFRHHGVAGCFQGLGANSLRFVPGRAVYFASFEVADRNLSSARRRNDDRTAVGVGDTAAVSSSSSSAIDVPATFAAGAFAGVCAWTSTYPFDVIRNKMMADDPDRARRRYRGVWDCARTTARQSHLHVSTSPRHATRAPQNRQSLICGSPGTCVHTLLWRARSGDCEPMCCEGRRGGAPARDLRAQC